MIIASAKDKEWANVITCHMNDNGGRTWRTKNKAIGDHALLSSDKSANKVACISACGNFGFIGSASGQIDMFNLQSGLHRKVYSGTDGHKKAITGLATDVANRYLISGSVDRKIKVRLCFIYIFVYLQSIPKKKIIAVNLIHVNFPLKLYF